MTVEELIEELKKLPSDRRVLVQGYEGGYSEARINTSVLVDLNVNKQSWYGPHEKSNPGPGDIVAAVLLRERNELSDELD